MTHAMAMALRQRASQLDEQLTRLTPQALRAANDKMTDTKFFVAARRPEVVQRLLSQAQIVEPHGCALPGSTLTPEPDDAHGPRMVELASPNEADAQHGRISVDGPLGMALLGRREGDTVRYSPPAGARTVRVAALR